MKAKFSHNINNKVMDNVQKVEDLLNLSTEGSICLAALDLFDMQSLKSTPREAPSNRSDEECKIFLHHAATTILAYIKPDIKFRGFEEEHHCQRTKHDMFCICNSPVEDMGGKWVAAGLKKCSVLFQVYMI